MQAWECGGLEDSRDRDQNGNVSSMLANQPGGVFSGSSTERHASCSQPGVMRQKSSGVGWPVDNFNRGMSWGQFPGMSAAHCGGWPRDSGGHSAYWSAGIPLLDPPSSWPGQQSGGGVLADVASRLPGRSRVGLLGDRPESSPLGFDGDSSARSNGGVGSLGKSAVCCRKVSGSDSRSQDRSSSKYRAMKAYRN